jgi:hypothetical protein
MQIYSQSKSESHKQEAEQTETKLDQIIDDYFKGIELLKQEKLENNETFEDV